MEALIIVAIVTGFCALMGSVITGVIAWNAAKRTQATAITAQDDSRAISRINAGQVALESALEAVTEQLADARLQLVEAHTQLTASSTVQRVMFEEQRALRAEHEALRKQLADVTHKCEECEVEHKNCADDRKRQSDFIEELQQRLKGITS